MRKRSPRILIIGLGRFGKEHLDTWKRLAEEGKAELAGAVASSEAKGRILEQQFGIPVYGDLDTDLLKHVDAVDIVTPSSTHCEIALKCLPFVHVLLEKPLGVTHEEIWKLEKASLRSRHVFMVNHLYRFHPVLAVLERLLAKSSRRPYQLLGCFLNPWEPGIEQYSANLEFLHYFDLVDHMFGLKPKSFSVERYGHVNEVSIQYPGGMNLVVELGWKGAERVRTLEIDYSDKKVSADFQESTVTVLRPTGLEKTLVRQTTRPLEASLRRFLEVIQGRRAPYPDAKVGARIVDTALRALPGPRKIKPSAIVIGGGIFGASCALEMAQQCDVLLAERHPELLTEASFNNQLRHHSGFHYPRSLDTVREILTTRADFDAVYPEAVRRDVASFYGTAATAKEITGERYLAFCKENQLNFKIENPPPGLLDTSKVSLCLRTDELVLDIVKLREMVHAKLAAHPRIDLALQTDVVDGRITPSGAKRMRLRRGSRSWHEEFDYLINATYANSNILAKWFGFPLRRLRFDVCEMMVLRVPMPPISITILDAPFISLMSTGADNLFLVYQVRDGCLHKVVTEDGMPPQWGPFQSNHEVMMRHIAEYLPILRDATYLESRFGIRAVTAFNEDFDGRATVVTRHGFGCWSVLGGKICTAVSNAREIFRGIFPEVVGQGDPQTASRVARRR